MERCSFRLHDGPVDGRRLAERLTGPDAGALVTFLGTARRTPRAVAEGEVVALEYEAHEALCRAEAARIFAEVLARHDVLRVGLEHAVGRVPVGQAGVAVVVAAVHRAPAFAAAAATMDLVKARLPVWKKEVLAGGAHWVGPGS